jgi:hypothetical protein
VVAEGRDPDARAPGDLEDRLAHLRLKRLSVNRYYRHF